MDKVQAGTAPSASGASILVVDDEEPIRFLCEDLLSSLGYQVRTAADGEQALEALAAAPSDIVICDLRMPGMGGIECIKAGQERFPGTDFIVLTGFGTVDLAVECMKLGAKDFLQKPFNLDVLINAVSRIVERRALAQKIAGASGEGQLQELFDQKQRELDALKDEFVAITSHELLTPLTPVAGYLETLKDGGLGQLTHDQREAIVLIHREIDKLRGHIHSLLRVKELQGGPQKLEWAQVDLRELITEAVRLVAPQATERRVAVHASAQGELEVRTDPQRLGEVLAAVLSNAIKFNREGGEVEIVAERVAAGLQVRIRDTGIGIAADQLSKVFDKFYQVERGDGRRYDGIGIGLTVARGIVAALGGTIALESKPGVGTTVTVALPPRS